MTSRSKKNKGVNPKDRIGQTKVSEFKLPAVAVAWASAAFMDGADKYDAYNWRKNSVIASVYIDALERHIKLYKEGRRVAKDSLVHELGHVIACASILLDAEANDCLVDDRLNGHEALEKVYTEIQNIRIAKAKKPQKRLHSGR